MKPGGCVVLAIALVIGYAMTVRADDGEKSKDDTRKCKAVPNLLVAIQSDNAGLRESAAFLLGEFKCTKAVIPLMEMLKSNSRESTRIVAALALCRIGDSRGVFAVKRAVTFDDSPKVRSLCAWYYNEYYEPGSYAFVPNAPSTPVVATK